MSGQYQFADNDELIDAASGEYGPEAQAEALQLLGVDVVGENGMSPDAEQAEAEWRFDLNQQLNAMEAHHGRPLTSGEVNFLAEETRGLQTMPNLVEKFGEQLGNRVNDSDSRRDLMAEQMADIDAGNDPVYDPDGRAWREESAEAEVEGDWDDGEAEE